MQFTHLGDDFQSTEIDWYQLAAASFDWPPPTEPQVNSKYATDDVIWYIMNIVFWLAVSSNVKLRWENGHWIEKQGRTTSSPISSGQQLLWKELITLANRSTHGDVSANKFYLVFYFWCLLLALKEIPSVIWHIFPYIWLSEAQNNANNMSIKCLACD